MQSNLRDEAAGYLRSEGYEVRYDSINLLVGSRPGIAAQRESVYVWVPDAGEMRDFGSVERLYRERFQRQAEEDPASQRFMLVESTEGMSREFRQQARRWEGVHIRVPIQFFDTAYKWEESHDASSALRELRESGASVAYRRVAQPWKEMMHGGTGEDLYPVLLQSLRGPSSQRRSIQFVVGPAGIGKSHLYSVVFARLYDEFMRAKQSQVKASRPIPLFPQALSFDDHSSVEAILRAFLRSEFARPLDEDVLRWRLCHGWATWLIDGLDEVISRDAGFYQTLESLFQDTSATTTPSILICVRDSLFETSRELRDFVDGYRESISVYRLQPWGETGKKQYAQIRLGARSSDFLHELRNAPALDDLAAVPFFCQLLIEEFRLGDTKGIGSELDLLDSALSRMIEREYGKDLLPRNVIAEQDVREFLAALAAEDLHGGLQGVAVGTVRELAQVIVTADLPDAEMSQLISNMMQLALFSGDGSSSSGRTTGRLHFQREVMEQYLLAVWIADALAQPQMSLAPVLGASQLPADSVTIRAVGVWAERAGTAVGLRPLMQSTNPIAFKNALQLGMAAHLFQGPTKLDLRGRDLTGVRFHDLDMSGSTFQGADLTDAVFDRCELRDCVFDNALLARTVFEVTADGLHGAVFGELARFVSMSLGGRTYESVSGAATALTRSTAVSVSDKEPCAVALQLRQLVQKYVYADGTARRSWHERRALTRGRRYSDPEPIIDALVRGGYLIHGDRDRYERPDEEPYREFVRCAKGEGLSAGMREIVSDLCTRADCGHVGAGGSPI